MTFSAQLLSMPGRIVRNGMLPHLDHRSATEHAPIPEPVRPRTLDNSLDKIFDPMLEMLPRYVIRP
jgi:hypothetical protein